MFGGFHYKKESSEFKSESFDDSSELTSKSGIIRECFVHLMEGFLHLEGNVGSNPTQR